MRGHHIIAFLVGIGAYQLYHNRKSKPAQG